MKKRIALIKGILFIVVAITFMTVNFYTIHQYVTPSELGFEVQMLNPTYFQHYFGEFFQHTWQNILFAMLFFGLGILELIGVKKND